MSIEIKDKMLVGTLIKEGLVKMVTLPQKSDYIKEEQIKSFKFLYNKYMNATLAKDQFLFLYDSMFRLFELKLAKNKLELLNKSPHKTLKLLLPEFYPSINNKSVKLNELVSLRHKVKKSGENPSPIFVETLAEIVIEIKEQEGLNEL